MKFDDAVKDFNSYQVNIMALQKTMIKSTKSITVKGGHFYNIGSASGSYRGLGFFTQTPGHVKIIHERIISLQTTLLHTKKSLEVINCYAPTLQRSEKPQSTDREDFYAALRDHLISRPKAQLTLVCGYFNAKTGSGHHQFPANIGRFGKGPINSSGECLAMLANTIKYVLSNTLFDHKFQHITTWQSSHQQKILEWRSAEKPNT